MIKSILINKQVKIYQHNTQKNNTKIISNIRKTGESQETIIIRKNA